MVELCKLHEHVFMVMVLIMFVISYMVLFLLASSFDYKHLSEGTFVETIWSILPSSLLIVLIIPSMKALYMLDDSDSPSYSLKVVGHQWYWEVEWLLSSLFDIKNFCLTFGMEMNISPFSLSRLFLSESWVLLHVPVHSLVRFLVSSTDVIHAFAIPSLGMKVDAVPGRINQLVTLPILPGVFYGQCSEICGANHSFMPFSLCVGSASSFAEWHTHMVSLMKKTLH